MENKNVGFLLLGIVLIIIVIIFLYDNALKEIVKSSCTGEHALTCPMYKTINQQTYLALAIAGVLFFMSFVLIFSRPDEKIVVKKVKEKREKKKIDLSSFKPDEKEVFKIVQEQGAMFQADLIENTGFGNAKMSRILDRLEGHGLVERKRRGMTNVVVLKD